MVNIDVLIRIGPILGEFSKECRRQQEKWNVQSHPNGTGRNVYWGLTTGNYDAFETALLYRHFTEVAAKQGKLTWLAILMEEVAEALAEDDPRKLRAELVQVGAVVASWIEKIDRIDLAGPGEAGSG